MEIIPVIDMRGGQVVGAIAGDRARYRPISTPLAPGTSAPVEVAAGYCRLFPFAALYVADLDAIAGSGNNDEALAVLGGAWRGALWLDQGPLSARGLPPDLAARIDRDGEAHRVFPVTGSESLAQGEPAPSLTGAGDVILSLDFRGETFLGPRTVLETPERWPKRIIVMTLARIGRAEGPDIERLEWVAQRAGSGRRVFAAGGVRNRDDVARLRNAGAAGALVATALHRGDIKTGDLEEIAGW